MIRVWRHGDKTMPKWVDRHTFRAGDEDYVVLGLASDPVAFELVAGQISKYGSNTFVPDGKEVVRIKHRGVEYLLFVECHA